MRPGLKRERGFTMIEIVMASAILIVGLTMFASVVTSIVGRNFYSQRHTQAVMLAQMKIEELLNKGYQSDDLDAGSYTNPLNPVNELGDSAGVFTQSWQIRDIYPINKAKFIRSMVQWNDDHGEVQTVTLASVCIDESN